MKNLARILTDGGQFICMSPKAKEIVEILRNCFAFEDYAFEEKDYSIFGYEDIPEQKLEEIRTFCFGAYEAIIYQGTKGNENLA